jgi:SSS family solute:Na+ symporter
VTVSLGPLDVAIVLLFVGAIFALGFSARLRENTTLQFIAAGRSLTLPVFVATLVATWYGGILGIGESVSWYGVGTWTLLGVPYYAFALLYAFLLAKRIRSADQISIPERIGATWGKGPALIAAVLVFFLGVPAAHVLMLGTLAQALTGWDLTASIVVATLVSSLFLYRGGLLADARVSLLSFAMMYVGFAVIVVFCLVRFPFGEAMDSLPATTKQWDGGLGAIGVVSFFILGAWTLIDPGFHQRVASARDPETGKRGVLVATVCWVVFDALTVTTGMYALSQMPSLPENKLLIFPMFGDQVLPSGLKAVFLCGMLGTILTAMVGYSLVSGATLGRDILARLTGTTDEAKATMYTRVGILVACLSAIVVSLAFKSVVTIWFYWGGTIIGALLVPTLASYLGGRLRSTPVAISMLCGFIISLAWLLYGSQSGKGLVIAVTADQSIEVGTLLPGVVASLLALVLCTVALGRSKT